MLRCAVVLSDFFMLLLILFKNMQNVEESKDKPAVEGAEDAAELLVGLASGSAASADSSTAQGKSELSKVADKSTERAVRSRSACCVLISSQKGASSRRRGSAANTVDSGRSALAGLRVAHCRPPHAVLQTRRRRQMSAHRAATRVQASASEKRLLMIPRAPNRSQRTLLLLLMDQEDVIARCFCFDRLPNRRTARAACRCSDCALPSVRFLGACEMRGIKVRF